MQLLESDFKSYMCNLNVTYIYLFLSSELRKFTINYGFDWICIALGFFLGIKPDYQLWRFELDPRADNADI